MQNSAYQAGGLRCPLTSCPHPSSLTKVLIFGGFAFHAEAGSLILDYRGRGPVWVVEDLSARGPIDDELTPASLQSIRDGAWCAPSHQPSYRRCQGERDAEYPCFDRCPL